MSVGIVDKDKTIAISKELEICFIVGSATGKDGIHGAASEDIDEDSADKYHLFNW